MNLQPISFKPSAYTCALTEKLDVLAKLTERKVFRHYVILDMDNSLIIRVPGGTVGVARFDADGKICEIKVDRDYVVKTYPENLDEMLFHFLGESLTVSCEYNKRENTNMTKVVVKEHRMRTKSKEKFVVKKYTYVYDNKNKLVAACCN